MANRDFLGRMDCIVCGLADGVKITEDKNGHPFGHCDAKCNEQYRIGSDKDRVQYFYDEHPDVALGSGCGFVKKRAATPPAQPAGGAVPVVPAKPADTTEKAPAAPKADRGFDLDDL